MEKGRILFFLFLKDYGIIIIIRNSLNLGKLQYFFIVIYCVYLNLEKNVD
jgi:hypothetical protein